MVSLACGESPGSLDDQEDSKALDLASEREGLTSEGVTGLPTVVW